MLRDSQGFETKIIDAVRSVNRALGGATGSTADRRSDYNQYEVQLIDAIRAIGRTLSGKGLSVAGGVAGDGSGFATVQQFQDLSRRVTKLEGESFFRLVDGNVTLKSEYQNLWVPGWLASGGIGVGGGGGGGSSYLRELLDVYHGSGGVLRADGTPAVAGDSLVYNATLGWLASPVSGGGGGSVVITQSTSSGVQTTTFTVDGVSTAVAVKSVAFGTQASDKIPITIANTTKNVLTAHQSLAGYVPTSRQVNGHALTSDVTVTKGDIGLGNVENTKLSTWAGSQNITTLGTIATGVWNGTAIGVTKGGTGLTSIAKGAVLYASANNVLSALAPNGTSTKKFLSQSGTDAPSWAQLSVADIADAESWLTGKGYALASDLSALSSRVASIEGWFEVVNVGTSSAPVYALHAKNNYAIYSDSWVASGGVGSGQGSGGASTLAQLLDVSLSTLADGDLLMYTASTTKWSNMRRANYLSGYATESWVNQQGFLKTETDPTVPSWAKAESKPSYSLSEISGTADLRAIEALTGTGLLKRTGTNAWSLDTTAYLSAHQSVTLASGTNNGTLKLTTAAGTTDNIAVKGLGSLAYKSSLATADIPDISGTYVTLSGAQTITGVKTISANMFVGGDIIPSTDLGPSLGYSSLRFANLNVRTIGSLLEINFKSQDNTAKTGYLTFKDGWMVLRSGADLDSSYKQINFHETYGFYPVQSGVNLGGSSANIRWQNIYGINANLTGDLSLVETSHIDIGPLRIEYDATNKALHITKKSTGDTNTYGIYADGFVASGGVGQTS